MISLGIPFWSLNVGLDAIYGWIEILCLFIGAMIHIPVIAYEIELLNEGQDE